MAKTKNMKNCRKILKAAVKRIKKSNSKDFNKMKLKFKPTGGSHRLINERGVYKMGLSRSDVLSSAHKKYKKELSKNS
jgi:hypothetical protein